MKKYLGSRITAFLAIVVPILFVIMPLVFGTMVLVTGSDFASVFVSMMSYLCVLVCTVYLKQIYNQLYSWGVFDKEKICVKTLFGKKHVISYNKCAKIGIGSYTHGTFLGGFGPRVYFLFFSYEPFEEKYRMQINFWKPSNTRIKVEFNQDLYEYLLVVLPKKQALVLKQEYRQFIETK